MSVAIHASGRADYLGKLHGPRAESRANIGDCHARLQLEELHQFGHFERCGFQLSFSQGRLLRRSRTRQQND